MNKCKEKLVGNSSNIDLNISKKSKSNMHKYFWYVAYPDLNNDIVSLNCTSFASNVHEVVEAIDKFIDANPFGITRENVTALYIGLNEN